MKKLYGTAGKTESEYVPTEGSIIDREGLKNIRKSNTVKFEELLKEKSISVS